MHTFITAQIFEDIVETINNPLLVMDSDLKVTLANRSFYRFFKVSPEETIGRLIYSLGDNQWDIPKLREMLEDILPKQKTFEDYEVEHDFATIGKRVMLLNGRQIEQEVGRTILLTIQDISEHKRLEDQLKESEERYRRLFETATDGIMLLGKHEGNIVRANPAIMEVLGYSEYELIEKGLEGIGFPDDTWDIHVILQALERDGILHYNDVALEKKDGQLVDTDIYIVDKAELVQCNIRDITERKHREEKLISTSKILHSIVENIPNMIFLKDADSLRFVLFNRAGEDLLGYSRDDLLGKSDHDLFQKEQADLFSQKDREVIDGKMIVDIPEEPIQTRNKGERTLHTKKVPILDSVGRPEYLLGISEDITDRKLAEEANEKLQGRLFQSQKMEAIGTLAGGIAHDFNNILAAIFGYTELAIMKVDTESEIGEDLKEVLRGAGRARELIRQILAFSRQTLHEQMPVQVGLIVDEATKLLRPSLPATIDIRKHILSNSIIRGDPTQLHQVVMNLCTNAAHAMQGKGGILAVTVTDVELDSHFCSSHPEIQPGLYLKLSVSDTGCGMPPEVMSRIFDPFYTTKPKDKGTGLGLSVVHGIVKDSGGTITVYSEPERGTAFHLYFPIIKSRAEEGPEGRTMIPTGTERILVVDDEKAIVEIIQRHLVALGYSVEAGTSSVQALELFKSMPGKFDLVITDMTMPQMSGDALAGELMKIRPDLPVILCTGFSEEVTKEGAESLGIRAFLQKPLLKAELAHTIRKVLDETRG